MSVNLIQDRYICIYLKDGKLVPWKHALGIAGGTQLPSRAGVEVEVVVVALVVVVEGEGCIEGEVTQLSVDRLT